MISDRVKDALCAVVHESEPTSESEVLEVVWFERELSNREYRTDHRAQMTYSVAAGFDSLFRPTA